MLNQWASEAGIKFVDVKWYYAGKIQPLGIKWLAKTVVKGKGTHQHILSQVLSQR